MSELAHNAFIYESDDQYVDGALSYMRDGLEAGERVIVASTKDRLAVLREALGDERERVRMIDVGSLYSRPARTSASYHRAMAEQLRSVRRVRLIAQVQYGPTPVEWDRWAAYEAIFTRAFADLSAEVICTYDARETPEAMVEHVWEVHPEVLTDSWNRSETCEQPEETIRRLTPPPSSPELRPLAVGATLGSFREAVAAELAVRRVPRERALEVLVAANELAANALQHGGGIEEVRAGIAEGRFVCEVRDGGSGFEDPLAGYIPPKPEQRAGRGLWIARQISADLELFRSDSGFTARIWV
jgi:anti-sigma regulatory factor (Ser/Thr protein kinase)